MTTRCCDQNALNKYRLNPTKHQHVDVPQSLAIMDMCSYHSIKQSHLYITNTFSSFDKTIKSIQQTDKVKPNRTSRTKINNQRTFNSLTPWVGTKDHPRRPRRVPDHPRTPAVFGASRPFSKEPLGRPENAQDPS